VARAHKNDQHLFAPHKCSQLFVLSFSLSSTFTNVIPCREMANLPPLLLLLWTIGTVVQLSVLFLVIAKHHFRSLPLFAVYIALNLCQAAFIFFVYSHFGFTSHIAWRLCWLSEPFTLVAQAPVSYTHLDVYKRQATSWLRPLPCAYPYTSIQHSIRNGRSFCLAWSKNGANLKAS